MISSKILKLVLWSILQVTMQAAMLKDLDVHCGKNEMVVYITFYGNFNGIIFSKGHYDDYNCHYVRENSERSRYKFVVPLHGCGTTSQLDHSSSYDDKYIENTLIVQEDRYIQGIEDLARNVRCVWKQTFSKVVTARPMSFNSIPLVFTKKSINSVTPLHVDTGPFEYPISGYIYMGDSTSMVVYIQDSSHLFDANVKGCVVTDKKGRRSLNKADGCYSEKSLMTPFYKTNSTGDSGATMMFYSYFQEYKLSHKNNFVINCELEVCPGKCVNPCSNPVFRKKREALPFTSGRIEKFFKITRKVNEDRNQRNSTTIPQRRCEAFLDCFPGSWIAVISILTALIAILLLLSSFLCFKMIKYNDYIARKLSREPLLA